MLPIDHKLIDSSLQLVNLFLLFLSPFSLRYFLRRTLDADISELWYWIPGASISLIFLVWQFTITAHYVFAHQP